MSSDVVNLSSGCNLEPDFLHRLVQIAIDTFMPLLSGQCDERWQSVPDRP